MHVCRLLTQSKVARSVLQALAGSSVYFRDTKKSLYNSPVDHRSEILCSCETVISGDIQTCISWPQIPLGATKAFLLCWHSGTLSQEHHQLASVSLCSGLLFSGQLFLSLPPHPPFKELLIHILWLKTVRTSIIFKVVVHNLKI